MGCSLAKRCSTNFAPASVPTPPPNPDPARHSIHAVKEFAHAHVLTVKYLDCTNFEGIKVMVYRGKYTPQAWLDPHFTEAEGSPIARFRPDDEGIKLAYEFAENLKP